MATINFEYRSRKPKANLSLRFRHYKKFDDGHLDNYQIEIRSNEMVKAEDWNNQIIDKEFKRRLEDIEDFILDSFNKKYNKGFKVTKNWIQSKYDEFCFGKLNKLPTKTLLTEWIQQEIDDLESEKMSKSRIKGFTTYKNIIEKYNQFLEVSEMNKTEFNSLRRWLINDRKYDLSTAEKLLDDIRTVCRNAREEGVVLPADFDTFAVRKRKSKAKEKRGKVIIVLTKDEINRIEKLKLDQNYLINARKWLILGCYTAQRGGDLLTRIVRENFKKSKKGVMIEFTQEKTGEVMEIKALPKVKQMYLENALPHKISLQNLNKYVKTLCKLAKVNEPIKYKIREKVVLADGEIVIRNVERTRPKYKYVSSHDFRRTFCTMFFRRIPNEEIMKFSGHKTTREFLGYVGAKDNDFSKWDELFEKDDFFYSKQER